MSIPSISSCDKCGLPVAPNEDVTILDALYSSDLGSVLNYKPRHILCDLSRARYIDHPEFRITNPTTMPPTIPGTLSNLVQFRIRSWTEAWVKLQTVCGLSIGSHTIH